MIIDLCIMAIVAACVIITYIMVRRAEKNATPYPDEYGEEHLPKR